MDLMLNIFSQRKRFARVVLWVLIAMLAVGMLGTTANWFFSPGNDNNNQNTKQQSQSQNQAEIDNLKGLLTQYEQKLAAKPGDLSVLTGYARVEAQLGHDYLKQGQQAEGADLLRKSAGHFQDALTTSDDLQVRLDLAGVYTEQNNLGQAEAQYRTVLQKDPQNVQARSQLALILEAQQDWKGAAAIWNSLTKNADQSTKDFAAARLKNLQPKLK
jgi:cytochrome c-type biogenesis protein CcmH/NrfG